MRRLGRQRSVREDDAASGAQTRRFLFSQGIVFPAGMSAPAGWFILGTVLCKLGGVPVSTGNRAEREWRVEFPLVKTVTITANDNFALAA